MLPPGELNGMTSEQLAVYSESFTTTALTDCQSNMVTNKKNKHRQYLVSSDMERRVSSLRQLSFLSIFALNIDMFWRKDKSTASRRCSRVSNPVACYCRNCSYSIFVENQLCVTSAHEHVFTNFVSPNKMVAQNNKKGKLNYTVSTKRERWAMKLLGCCINILMI